MAEFRIDQATPGPGIAGRSRHDLVAGEVITLVATAPTGGGVTYTWEILDKVGSTAVLSATTGASVTIGLAGAITQPCAFLIRLTANDGGIVTVTDRIASVRSLLAGLRAPLFPETAPTTNKLSANNPDSSTDNANYTNRAGLGASGQNWRGWGEWAYEVILAVEASFGGGGPPTGPASGDLSGTYPSPTVDAIQGRAVVATLPTNGQVYAWNTGTSQWEPTTISGVPSGPATGDLSGVYPSPTVDAIQGVAISAAAPTNGQLLTYNSGTLQWEPAGSAVGASNTFVFQPGGTASGNVYTSWALLYAAAAALNGPKIIYIDDQFTSPAVVPSGAYDFSDWRFIGVSPSMILAERAQLQFANGATWTIASVAIKSVSFEDLDVLSAATAASNILLTGAGAVTLRVMLRNAYLEGNSGGPEQFIDATGAGTRTVRIDLFESDIGSDVIDMGGATAQATLRLYDGSSIDSGSVVGGAGSSLFINLFGSAVAAPSQAGYAGSETISLVEDAALTFYFDANVPITNLAAAVQVQAAIDRAKSHAWGSLGAGTVLNGPINEQQAGTTELHIGSIWLPDVATIKADSRAMIGGSIITETGILKLRRFTGGALVASWTRLGTLADKALDGAVDIGVPATDWYDLFLVAGGAGETAILKGLRLNVVPT